MGPFDWLQGQAATAATPAPAAGPTGGGMPTLTPAPTRDPQEIEARKAGWQQMLTTLFTNPNFSRALGMFGQSLAAPLNPGEGRGSRLTQSLNVGRSAYDFGKQAEYERQLSMNKEQRAQAESQSKVAWQGAQTAKTQTETQFNQATMQDRVAQIRTAAKQAEVDLAKARNDKEKQDIQLRYDRAKQAIFANDPQLLIDSVTAEVQKQGIENNLRRAQAAEAGARTLVHRQQAEGEAMKNIAAEREYLDESTLSPRERLQRRSKTGAWSTGFGSAQVQAAEYLKQQFKAAHPEATDAQVAAVAERMLTQTKGLPHETMMMKLMEIEGQKKGESRSEYTKRISDWAYEIARLQTGGAPVPRPQGTGTSVGTGTTRSGVSPGGVSWTVGPAPAATTPASSSSSSAWKTP